MIVKVNPLYRDHPSDDRDVRLLQPGSVRIVGGSDWHDCVDLLSELDSSPVLRAPSRVLENRDRWIGLSKAEQRRAMGLFKSLNLDDESVIRMLELYASAAPDSDVKRRVTDAIRHYRTTGDVLAIIGECQDTGYIPRTPDASVSAYAFASDHQIVSLIRKYPFSGRDESTRYAAVLSFLATEEANKVTNMRWRDEEPSGFFYTLADRLEALLGPCPDMDAVIERGNWGPGTTVDFPFGSELTGVELKSVAPVTHMFHNSHLLPRVLDRVPLWGKSLAAAYPDQKFGQVVGASKQSTVPKNAVIQRVIFVEPLLELFIQAGIEYFLREALKREQRDLDKAWYTCQELALAGSVTGIWCTVDLSAASDSVCLCPLKTLLSGRESSKWFSLMDQVRSKYGDVLTPSGTGTTQSLEPVRHRFELFSSMGNGFTFGLESVLFYAVITSIVPGVWVKHHGATVLRWPHVGVFGDDLVFPVAYAPQVVSTLEWLGFRVNLRKSYFSGPFRESCGRDFFNGVDVRPLFLTRRYDNGALVVELANRVMLRGSSVDHYGAVTSRLSDERWAPVHRHLVRSIPKVIRELQPTPDHVPQGLWLGEHSVQRDTLRGCARAYKLFKFRPRTVDLSNRYLLTYGGFTWQALGACSWNVLLARLRSASIPQSPFAKMAEGRKGETGCRDQLDWVVGVSVF